MTSRRIPLYPLSTVPASRLHAQGKQGNQATRLVDLALAADVELWHSPAGDPQITIALAGHREHHALGTRAVRDWLAQRYYGVNGCAPASQAIADALTVLAGRARFDGAEHSVHVRVAEQTGAVYVDLGDASWRAIEITTSGWRVIAAASVRFRRGRALRQLPLPTPGGSLAELRELITVHDDED
jgi:hypothetical protein